MMITDELLSILVCPKSKKPLTLAPSEIRDKANVMIREEKLTTVQGAKVGGELSDVLLCEEEGVGYPVRSDIPVLLIEEAFSLNFLT
jgi:uncharacterized protein YbaR (Trm112 family)